MYTCYTLWIIVPASMPFMVFAKLQTPSPPGINFQITRTVTPPDPAAIDVDVTADPSTRLSPGSLTDIYS